jgi:hypothetical protein
MTQPPALATVLLNRLGPCDESLVGDLHEEFAAGRSRSWFWRQAIAAIACGAATEIRRSPARAGVAITTGWAVVAIVFLLGDRIADGLAGLFWQWHRQTAYVDHVWWPFYIGAAVVTYAGFGLSAVIVAWMDRERPAMLIAYVGSVFSVLAITGLVLEILIVRHVIVPIPHPLFYAVSMTLPFYWHSGILLVPLTTLLCGMIPARRRTATAR